MPSKGENCLDATTASLLAGDLAKAAQLLDVMEGVTRAASSKVFYHSLIHRCAKAGNPEAAGWCIERMLRRGVKANPVTFNSVIDAAARVGNVAFATQWFEEMSKADLRPNGITYNTMIKAFAKAHDPAGAELWLQRMEDEGFFPCLVSFSTVIDALAKKGDVEKAETWYKRMRDAGVQADAVIFNTLINACAKASQPDKAEAWLRELQGHGLVPDAKTYNSLLNAYARVGDLQQAERWFAEMERSGCRSDTMIFGCLLHACAKAGDCCRAEYWIEEMARRGIEPNAFCTNTLLQACARQGDHTKATKWFVQLMLSNEADLLSYSSMVETFAAAGDLDTAERWLRRMVTDGLDANHVTLAAMVRGCGTSSQRGFTATDPGQWAYECILRTYCKVGVQAQVRGWAAKMAAAGLAMRKPLVDDCAAAAREGGHAGLAAEVHRLLAQGQAVEGGAGNALRARRGRREPSSRWPLGHMAAPTMEVQPQAPSIIGRSAFLAAACNSWQAQSSSSTASTAFPTPAVSQDALPTAPGQSCPATEEVLTPRLTSLLLESGYTVEQQRTMNIQRLSF